jgi:CIC family chloride channel protein
VLLVLADELRGEFVVWTHRWPYIGWLGPVGLGLAGAALARLMVVRLSPEAEGSGVQRVEAMFSDKIKPAGPANLPVKFIGGLLAMGSGLALGREGPTVQMGAFMGGLASRLSHKNEEDTHVLEAASAGAGLAVAFNAPIGGSIFVFEELTLSFTPSLLVATLSAAAVAVWILYAMLGRHFAFSVPQVTLTTAWRIWPFLLLGSLLGVIGTLYNRIIIVLLRFMDRSSRFNSVLGAAFIGGTIGLAAWFEPMLVGGGDNLTQAVLSGRYTIVGLAVLFGLRFFIGPWSYAARTPGGLFGPMLVLGASFGALFGDLINRISPGMDVSAIACAVVGMGALFSACVRAPLTGIVLTMEMTGRGDLTLGLVGASLVAIVTTMLLNGEPIYETLKHRMLDRQVLNQQTVPPFQDGLAPH